jgi:hypothetical protein
LGVSGKIISSAGNGAYVVLAAMLGGELQYLSDTDLTDT